MKNNSQSSEAPQKGASGSGFLRTLSILAAASVVLLIAIYPRAVTTDGINVKHGWLELMMVGMSCCWVYGLNFVPRNRALRIALPWIGWIALIISSWKIFF